MIHVEIPGEPFALKRARKVRTPVGTRMHDHPENESWKATAGVWMLRARAEAGITSPLVGPVTLTAIAYFRCPKGDERKREPREERWSLSAKDLDNIVKAVGDAGNGILWVDDHQIVRVVAEKWIARQGDPPRVDVRVEEAEVAT